MRVDAFRTVEAYKHDMDDWIEGFRKAATVKGQDKVLIPGDPEREAEVERRASGIPLLPAVADDLKALGEKMGVPF